MGGSRVHRRPVRSCCPRHLSPSLHSLFARIIFYPTSALGNIKKYIQCPSKQSVTCDGDYIDDIDDNDDKNDDDDDGDVDCKHAVVCTSS